MRPVTIGCLLSVWFAYVIAACGGKSDGSEPADSGVNSEAAASDAGTTSPPSDPAPDAAFIGIEPPPTRDASTPAPDAGWLQGRGFLQISEAPPGLKLNALDGLALLSPPSVPGASRKVSVFFQDKPHMCSEGVARPNSTLLAMEFEFAGGESGNFAVQADAKGPAPYARLFVGTADAACHIDSLATAVSGSASASLLNPSGGAPKFILGSFDVMLPNGRFAGGFEAQFDCDAPSRQACQP